MLWRNRYLIIVGAVAGFVAALIYARLATPVYATTAKIFLQKSGAATNAQDSTINSTVLDTQCEYLKSTPLLALAIKDSDAERMELFSGIHNRIGYLKTHLDVETASRGSCILVTLNSTERDEAQQLVDALTGEYRDFETHQQHAVAANALAILERDKAKLDADADAKSKQLADVQAASSASGGNGAADQINIQRMAALSQALTSAQLKTLDAKSAYAQAASAAGINISDPDWIAKNAPDVSDSAANDAANPASESEDAARAELFRLRQQKDSLSKQYLPGHPAIVQLNAKINELSKSLLASARRRWLTAADGERQLQESYDRQQQQVISQSNQNATIGRLEADLKRDQAQSDSLDRRIGDLTVSMEGSSLEIPMIEPAATSDTPVWPRPLLTTIAGIIAGMLLGAGAGAAWEAAGREKIASAKTSAGKGMLGLPVFATVPRQGEVSIRHVAWSAHLRPESSIAQAFRAVKDGLDTAAAGQEGLAQARTILIASPLGGEGRTIAASNLAITLAKSGKRVCLIDADLRSPALAKVYAMREDFGFVELLSGPPAAAEGSDAMVTTIAQRVDRAVQRSVIERLDLIPAGGKAENPEELLNRPSLAEALEELSLKYDHIVLDGPSVLSSADSRIIAASCDATVLLLSQEASTRKVGEQCRDGLVSVGANVVGVIINSAPRLTGSHKTGKPSPTRTERLAPTRKALPGETTRAGEVTRDSIRPPMPQLPLKSRL